jgi:hypothetical protein
VRICARTAVLLLSTIVVAGCGGAERRGVDHGPPTPLDGVYSTRFVGGERPRGDPGAQLPLGRWHLTFIGHDAFLLNPAGGEAFDVGNPVRVSRGTVTFQPDPKCSTQSGTPTRGVYRYQRRAATLTFILISDSCDDRSAVLTSHPWRRDPEA